MTTTCSGSFARTWFRAGVAWTRRDHEFRRAPEVLFYVKRVVDRQAGTACTKRQHAAAVSELQTIITEIDHVEITGELARNAGDLAQAQKLRGYGAVHLGAAMAALDVELVLVTADKDLAGAARSPGLPIALTT